MNNSDIAYFLHFGFLRSKKTYIHKRFNRNIKDMQEAIDKLDNLLQEILNEISDDDITLLLSGGIDSTVLLVNAKRAGLKLDTLSVSFNDYDESNYAKALAHHLDIPNTTINYSFDDFKNAFETMLTDGKILVSSAAMVVFSDVISKKTRTFINGAASDEGLLGYDYQVKTLEKLERNKEYKRLFPNDFHSLIPDNSLLKNIFDSEDCIDLFHDDYMPLYLDNQELSRLFSEKIKKQFKFNIDDAFDELTRFQYDVLLPECQLKRLEGISKYSGKKIFIPYADERIIKLFGSLSKELILNNGKRKYILYESVREYIPKELYSRDKFPFTVPIDKWFFKHPEWITDLIIFYGKKHNISEKSLKWFIEKNLSKHDYNSAEKLLILVGTLSFFAD